MESIISNSQLIKNTLIKQAVKQLQRFGFTNVNKDNIETDEVYSQYFLKILNEKLGDDSDTDVAINLLVKAIHIKTKQKI